MKDSKSDGHLPLDQEEKQLYLRLLSTEKTLNREIAELIVQKERYRSAEEIMNLLHAYNDIKDATQIIFGAVASVKKVDVASLHEEYGLLMK